MRIKDLAGAVGVSTRTVRHYHQVGVLPEPERTASGYREYTFDDLIRLLHVRRLAELGLGLAEIREALTIEASDDLSAILDALDADLAEQARVLSLRRTQLAALRARWEGQIDVGDLGYGAVSAFRRTARAAGAAGPMFELDHQVMALLPTEQVDEWVRPVLDSLQDPESAARLVDIYARFDGFADGYDEGELASLLDLIRQVWPADLTDRMRETSPTDFVSWPVIEAAFDQMTPPQRAAADDLIAALMKKD